MEPGASAVLSRRRFDVDDYHRMISAGIVQEDDRVELLDGEIVQMHGAGRRHAACVLGLTHRLVTALTGRALIGIQNPVRLGRYSEPEPDVSVLRPREDLYVSTPPTPEDVFLVIEVADSSLAKDRSVKLELYAEAGVRELWIVDLTSDALLAHRDPEPRGYRSRERLTAGRIAPLAFPDLELDLTEILPPEPSA